jgi:hypothetical protein
MVLLTVCADSLILDNNTLTGTIPIVINSIDTLSEFVGQHMPSPSKILMVCLCFTVMLFLGANILTGNFTCADSITYCLISCALLDIIDPTSMSVNEALEAVANANPACRSL